MGLLVCQWELFLSHRLIIPVIVDLFFLVMTHAPVKLMESGQEVSLHVVSNQSAITILLEQIFGGIHNIDLSTL